MSDPAKAMLRDVPDGSIRRKIGKAIEKLEFDPDKQGKPLRDSLTGLRSKHAAGRYRLVFQVDEHILKVTVKAIGIRKQGDLKVNIYDIANRMRSRGEI